MNPAVRTALRVIAVALGYALLNRLASSYAIDGVSMVYPASALGVVAAFVWRWETALAVFLATLFTPWQDTPLASLLPFAFGNVAEALLPTFLVKPRKAGHDLAVAKRFFLWTCIANTALNFAIAHTPRIFSGDLTLGPSDGYRLLAWVLADGTAVAVLGIPALLALRPDLFTTEREILPWSFLRRKALVAGCLFLALAVSVAIYHFDRLGLGPFNWPAVLYMVPLTIMLLAGGLPGVTVMNAVVATAYVATLALEARYAVVAPLRTPAHLVQIYGNLLFFLIFASFAGSLRTRNMWLVERLRQRWERLRETFDTTVTALSAAVETTDPSTLRHLDRVRTHAVKIAERLELPPRQVDLVRYGAVLHDVGKIAVPHNLLTKPGPLTPDEMAAVQRHVELGAVILERIGAFGEVIPLVRYHEERWDGRTEGPYAGVYGLKGEDIPLGARIIAVADAYDAMVSDRPYRKAPGPLYAARELAREAGAQFDPQVVAVFLQLLEEERVASEPAQAA